MRFERIEINYEAIDLGTKSISLNLKSNILKKIDEYTCCYSYTYSAPMTARNKSILGNLLVVGNTNNKVRQHLPATYYRDGLKIFDGTCYVSDATADSISLVFQFGINTALQNIKADKVKLSSLWNDADNKFNAVEGESGLANMERFIVKYPVESTTEWLKYDDRSEAGLCPVVPLRNHIDQQGNAYVDINKTYHSASVNRLILPQITKRYGIEFENIADNNDMFVQFKPNLKRYTKFKVSTESIRYEEVHTGVHRILSNFTEETTEITSPNQKEIMDGLSYPDFWYSSGNIYARTDYVVDKVTITATCSVSCSFHFSLDSNETWNDYGTLRAGETFSASYVPKDENKTYKVNWGKHPVFMLYATTQTTWKPTASMTIEIECHFDGDGESTGGMFNVFDTLPDIDVTRFLFDVPFLASGKFPINVLNGGNVLKYTSLDEIALNDPLDWSSKLQYNGLKVMHRIDGLAKQNWFKWADDDSENAYKEENVFCTVMNTEDSTLENTADYYESVFSYAFRHDDGGCFFVTYNRDDAKSPAPRLMTLAFGVVLVREEERYAQFFNVVPYHYLKSACVRDVFRKPLRIECNIAFNAVDLATIDFAKPVYLKQFGALFFIEEIQVGDKETAKVKLVRLK